MEEKDLTQNVMPEVEANEVVDEVSAETANNAQELETLREEKLNEDPGLYYKTLVDIREEKNIKWKDDEIKKQYNKLMDQLIESAKEQKKQ